MRNGQTRNTRNMSNPRNSNKPRQSSVDQRTRGLSHNDVTRNQHANTAGASLKPVINLDQFTASQKNINSAIFEYLLKFGFNKTVE